MNPNQAYLSTKQAAEYLGIGLSTLRREWPGLMKYGVIPSRYPKRTLRFKRTELDAAMEALKVE